MDAIQIRPGKGFIISSLTTTSQSEDVSAASTRHFLVLVLGVNAAISSGDGSATAASDGTDLVIPAGGSVAIALPPNHDFVAAKAISGSGGTVYIYPLQGSRA